jgi:hypothetical protein
VKYPKIGKNKTTSSQSGPPKPSSLTTNPIGSERKSVPTPTFLLHQETYSEFERNNTPNPFMSNNNNNVNVNSDDEEMGCCDKMVEVRRGVMNRFRRLFVAIGAFMTRFVCVCVCVCVDFQGEVLFLMVHSLQRESERVRDN